jgi:hypothetical protein
MSQNLRTTTAMRLGSLLLSTAVASENSDSCVSMV